MNWAYLIQEYRDPKIKGNKGNDREGTQNRTTPQNSCTKVFVTGA
jgi:hypothetical protein